MSAARLAENRGAISLNGLARAILVAAAGLASVPASVVAASPTMGCFSRAYDAAHLRRHPDQQVRLIRVLVEPSRYDPGKIDFGIIIKVRDRQQEWRAGGRCEPGDSGLKCQPDTDGASPILISQEGRQLRLTNPGRLKVVDDVTGPDLNDMLIAGRSDKSFLLKPAPAACKAGDRSRRSLRSAGSDLTAGRRS